MTDVTFTKDQKEEIGYAWNFVADLGNARQLSITGNFAKGVSLDEMNAEVDKIRAILDRQQAKSASRGAEEEIQQLELRLSSAVEDYNRIEEKNSAKGSLSAAERQQKEAAVVHLEKMGKDIVYKKTVLSKLQKEAM